MIDKYGLFSVPKLLGVSIYKVISMINGAENLKLWNRHVFIDDYLSNYQPIEFYSEIDTPLILKTNKESYHEIEYLRRNYASISIKDGLTHKPKSTYTIGITELPDEIFDIFVNLYWEGS